MSENQQDNFPIKKETKPLSLSEQKTTSEQKLKIKEEDSDSSSSEELDRDSDEEPDSDSDEEFERKKYIFSINNLIKKINSKSPLRYPGGKTRACKV